LGKKDFVNFEKGKGENHPAPGRMSTKREEARTGKQQFPIFIMMGDKHLIFDKKGGGSNSTN